MIEAKSLSEIEGQLSRTIAVGVGPWWRTRVTAENSPTDMNWIDPDQMKKLEEIMDWCSKKYPKQYDAIISEHVQSTNDGHRIQGGIEYKHRKWFDVRLSFSDPNAALEFKMVWN